MTAASGPSIHGTVAIIEARTPDASSTARPRGSSASSAVSRIRRRSFCTLVDRTPRVVELETVSWS
ncbi:hypothetical protein CMMCAS05_06255 [Clavibacter michiganensis subsp. michiganensis]|nr:hypothetical protein CMMCAS04_12820 [Clavibacter michiganensis subsp. michiganensis]OUD93201.1 hypothetical protein CMMCAS05_06255 [Clavibacter michiganensis subsp. michiganensis]